MAQTLEAFAQIAAHTATRASGLVELPAVPSASRILPNHGKRAWHTPRTLRSAADLAAELARLRRHYARFQRDLAPTLPGKRPRVMITAMDWRLAADPDRPDQAGALAGSGTWSKVTIPHYGGPVGQAVAWYRCTFKATAELLAKPR